MRNQNRELQLECGFSQACINSNLPPLKDDVFHLMSLNLVNPLSEASQKPAPEGSKSDCFLCHFILRRLGELNQFLSMNYAIFRGVTALRSVSLYRLFSPITRHNLSLYFSPKFKLKIENSFTHSFLYPPTFHFRFVPLPTDLQPNQINYFHVRRKNNQEARRP